MKARLGHLIHWALTYFAGNSALASCTQYTALFNRELPTATTTDKIFCIFTFIYVLKKKKKQIHIFLVSALFVPL